MVEEERGQREVEIDVPEDYRKMRAPEFVKRVYTDLALEGDGHSALEFLLELIRYVFS